MPRHLVIADRRRHLLPLPEPQRAQQPFLWDGRNLIAPWPRSKRELPEIDQQRLDAVAARIAEIDTGEIVWIWPDRPPVAVGSVDPGWARHWARDRATYRLEA